MEPSGQNLRLLLPDSRMAEWASRLIFASDPPYYVYVYGSELAAQKALLDYWLVEAGNPERSSFRVIAQQVEWLGIVSFFESIALYNTHAESVEAGTRQWIANQMFPAVPECSLYIRTLAIDPTCRGRGVGHSLLAELTSFAQQRKLKQLVVDVDSGNPRAVRFYERFGFEIAIETVVRALLPHQLPASYRMIKTMDFRKD